MSRPPDPVRLSKTMSFLLRHRPDAGGLTLDPEGFADLGLVVEAVGQLMRAPITVAEVEAMLDDAPVMRFEVLGGRIRAVRDRRKRARVTPPDILYHASNPESVAAAHATGFLKGLGDKPLYLSPDEAQAWRVAHRGARAEPTVLYVDSTRARRHGVRFSLNRRTGLYATEQLPVSDVLNLQENFAEQKSAGGVPIRLGADGKPRMALIRVTRRSGVTWEVAKGKLERGETPESAGIREVQEEMGLDAELVVTGYVGLIRYGFLAPGGLPRLKSVYLYLMELVTTEEVHFEPRAAEGIGDVQWFTPDEACRAVTHSSLRPIMRTARELVERRYGVAGPS